MSFEYKNNSLCLSGRINASDYNEVIHFYSQIPLFQYQHYKAKGDRITASDWQDLSDYVQALRNQNYTIPWVPSGFARGNPITAMSWSNAIYRELKTPGDYSFQAPNETRSIELTWLMAAGGSGGGGSEAGFGASGGGGGAGGYQQNIRFSLLGGEMIKFRIGANGVPTPNDGKPIQGGNGGDTILFINDVEIVKVMGGQGGENASSAVNKHNPLGGNGGNPNGLNGKNGLWANNNDKLGGAGGDSPFGKGGQPTWNNVGENGSGYGAGGGGGCTKDRQDPNFWVGGFGGGGYTLFNLTH